MRLILLLKYAVLSLLLSVVCMAVANNSKDQEPVSTSIDVFVVDNNDGKDVLRKQKSVNPGQLLEYHIKYKNNTSTTIRITSAGGMIPENTIFVEGSDKAPVSALFKVSIDKARTFETIPVKRTRLVEGRQEVYVVPASEYTNVSWTDPDAIAPGETQLYRYRVRVK